MYKNLSIYVAILFFALYMLYLYYLGKLPFYIHPRYISFTYVSALVALFFSTFGIQHAFAEIMQSKPKLTLRFLPSISILFLPLILGFALPAKPLSAATAAQRSIDLATLGGGSEIDVEGFGANTKVLKLGDWVRTISVNPDLEKFVGKEVDITGFVYSAESQPNGTFTLARFILTCCAVDARPVGLNILSDQSYSNDTWLRVEGKFELRDNTLVIVPSNMQVTEIPNNPYIY